MDKNKLLKTNEAAKYLGVSRSSLTNWIKQGLIGGGATPGGHYRFTVSDLDAFAEKRGLAKPSGASAAAEETERDGDTVRLLVVDDDDAFREFVHDALEVFSSYELRDAEDGMKGALLIGSWKPDLVILDIRMPNMNGMELLKLMHENPATAGTHVIVASAHLSPELKKEVEDMGVDIVLEKPVHLVKLVASIQKLVDLELA